LCCASSAAAWFLQPAGPGCLVRAGEEFVFFLQENKRALPETSARLYDAVAVWSGKAKIVDGKIQFLPAAGLGLFKLNNTRLPAFLRLVKQQLAESSPRK
jgi:hypothetical protein